MKNENVENSEIGVEEEQYDLTSVYNVDEGSNPTPGDGDPNPTPGDEGSNPTSGDEGPNPIKLTTRSGREIRRPVRFNDYCN